MDWDDTPEQAAFRRHVRAFLDSHLPQHYAADAPCEAGEFIVGWFRDRVSPDENVRRAALKWTKALAAEGWVAPHWPTEYGGAGLTHLEQFVLNEEMVRAGAPLVGGNGMAMLGPTLILHGTEDQRRSVLPGILSGDVAWVQGYSEPGAGSDLAAVRTRAQRDGDDYVVNGQKIWTSNAHHADAIFMLVRTDSSGPRHRGITFLMVDSIRRPGISVRPLADMSWDHSLNEVFS